MVAVRPPTLFTEREYLALEGVAEVKHEYVGGEIVAMAGAEPEHNQVCHNVHTELAVALKATGRRCRVLGSDQRIKVEATQDYFYPDIVVTCLDAKFVPPRPSSLVNPQIVFEVLSPSTESYDRGAKWFAYQQIPTLTDYVLISTERVKVQHYQLTAEGWLLRDLHGGALRLTSDLTLDVRSLYELVVFDED